MPCVEQCGVWELGTCTYFVCTCSHVKDELCSYVELLGRRGGVLVNTQDSEASGTGLSPSRCHYVLLLAERFALKCLSPHRSINGCRRIKCWG